MLGALRGIQKTELLIMAETTEAPSTTEPIPNPVIKDNFADAKSAFLQARIDEGLDKPKEATSPATPEATETEQVVEKQPDTSDVKDDKSSIIPDDIFEPKETDKPSIISTIEAAELPKGAKESTIKSFKELKTKSIEAITTTQSRIQELERKLSEATTNKEIETLKERLKSAEQKAVELEDGWAKTSLETSPQFQRQFVKREQQALEQENHRRHFPVHPGAIRDASRRIDS